MQIIRRVIGVIVLMTLLAGALLALATLSGRLAVEYVRTDSMSCQATGAEECFSAGDLIISKPIPAAEVAVGQVVVVRRPDGAYVAHRVASIGAVPSDPEARSLTLRGDASAADDPYVYEVTEARLVVTSVPHIGGPLYAALHPPGLLWTVGGLAVVAVAYLRWPHPHERRRDASPDESTLAITHLETPHA